MKRNRISYLLCVLAIALVSPTMAQTIDDLKKLRQDTFTALNNGQQEKAQALFEKFSQDVRGYLRTNQADWKIKFMVGSLECQFPGSRKTGAGILRSVLQDSRDLNEKGKEEIGRWLADCTSQPAARNAADDLSGEIMDVSAHLQTPGLHAATKAGYMDKGEHVSGAVATPMPAAELLARRVPITDPQKALDAASLRVPKEIGSVVGSFVIMADKDDRVSDSKGIGNCLQYYLAPLRNEFEIDHPQYMVTVYTAHWPGEVYENARKLHGLTLPQGVVAYSVLEDMSLSGLAFPNACGSLAHELVHLLIKPKFAMGPAWLEEGLASQVAVAVPHPDSFSLAWSWRDTMLENNLQLRPSVATLLEAPWGDFNAKNHDDLTRAAALQAMAAVFIRYLDAKGKLKDVYFAARDQHISADLSQYRSYSEILEQILGQNVESIDRDFVAWFKHEQEMLPKDNTPKSPPCKGPKQGPCETMKTAS